MNWEDVTLGQYEEIKKIEGEEKLEYMCRIASILYSKDIDEIYNLSFPELNKMLLEIDFSEPIKPRFTGDRYVVNGKVYVLTCNANTMTTGQYIDYSNTLSNDPDNMGNLLAILLIPEGKKYGEDYDPFELANELRGHLKVVDALGICFFFQEAFRIYKKNMLEFSLKKQQKMEKKGQRKV